MTRSKSRRAHKGKRARRQISARRSRRKTRSQSRSSIEEGGGEASTGAYPAPAIRDVFLQAKQLEGRLSKRALVWQRSFLLNFPFAGFRLFHEGVRVKLSRKIFDRRDDARGRTVHGVADDCVTAIVDSIQDAPSGKSGESFDSGRNRFGMHNGYGSRPAQSIRDKGVFANGDERLVPNYEENALCGR